MNENLESKIPIMEDSTSSLPKVIVITPPPVFLHLEPQLSRHFRFLKAYTSPLPLPAFLAAANSAGVAVMLVTATGPPITAASVFDHIPSLRCLVSTAAGVDFIDLDECRRRRISVANAAGASSSDCADFAVGLLIDVVRKVTVGDRFVRSGGWCGGVEFPLGRRLRGKTAGIVGLGRIGSAVAKRLHAFNCSILYNSRNEKPSTPYTFYSDVRTMAADSDFLIICCALSDQTRHMINKEVLTALGKDGIVVNVARGSIVDETDLVQFLLDGRIAGVGLDVFEHEPSVPRELLSMDNDHNVVLAHHQAGFTDEGFQDLFRLVKGNLDAFFDNQPLLTPVA